MGPTAVGGAGAPLDPPLALPLLLGIGRFATLLRAFSWRPPIAMLEVVPDTLSFTAAVTSARSPRLLLRTRNNSASTKGRHHTTSTTTVTSAAPTKTSSDTYGFEDMPEEKRIRAIRMRRLCQPLCSTPLSSVLLKATADYAATKSPRKFCTRVQHSPTIFSIYSHWAQLQQ